MSFSSHSIEKLLKLLISYDLPSDPKQLSHQHIFFLSRVLSVNWNCLSNVCCVCH